jgi:hypothetical protein
MFPKPKRIVDKELLAEFKNKPCAVGKNCLGDVVAHHIKTKGSGGHDVSKNLRALCVRHHTEIHAIGAYTFLLKYPWVTD